jgi:outer membrane lipoprotein-sorting protein
MKKVILVLTALFVFVTINAQSLEDIVRKQSQALKEDKLDNIKTMKITGKMSQMGMDLIMTLYFKSPNKVKNVMSFNGSDIIQVFDGTKGYIINPMTGSAEPQELPADQSDNLKNNGSFKSPVARYFKEGKLTLEGEENVKERPAYKIKAVDGVNTFYFYIDKSSYLPIKMSALVSGMSVDSYTEWVDMNGLMLPKTTTTQAQGMEFVMTFEKVEIDIPIDDSVFKVK